MKTLTFCRILWYNVYMENREMQTSNTEEMVTISRAEYERLQQENAQLEAKSATLEETHARLEAKLAAREQEQAQVITSLTLQNEWLLEQLKLSKKKLFGRSSEQAEQMVMEQLSLTYNELEAYAFGTKAATEKQITVKAHERRRQSGNVLDVVPEGTPTEVVEHRLPENELTCSACGSKLVEIGKEVRRSLLMPEERYEKRLEQEKPVLDALLSWANEMQAKTAPKSALGRAIHYLLEQWPYLTRYLEDGRLELSNNRAERSIKPFVMGRKNWLFANTPGGAQASAVIYSLIETAKENKLDPYKYLLWVLQSAPGLSQADEFWAEKLLPANAPQECHVPQ